jgi:hypothetical protein
MRVVVKSLAKGQVLPSKKEDIASVGGWIFTFNKAVMWGHSVILAFLSAIILVMEEGWGN